MNFAILKKLENRIVKTVQSQEISGDIYHIIITCHDGLMVEFEAVSGGYYGDGPYITIQEIPNATEGD